MNLRIKAVNQNWASMVAYGPLQTDYKIGEWSFASEESLAEGYGLFFFKDLGDKLPTVYSRVILCETRVRMPDKPIYLAPSHPEAGLVSLGNDAEMWAACRPIADITNGELCYKVVKPSGSSLLMQGYACTEYGLGAVSQAPAHLAAEGMHLTALDSLEHANHLADGKSHVYRAIGLRPRLTPSRAVNVGYAERKYGEPRKFVWNWPLGTLMYEQIILVERVR